MAMMHYGSVQQQAGAVVSQHARHDGIMSTDGTDDEDPETAPAALSWLQCGGAGWSCENTTEDAEDNDPPDELPEDFEGPCCGPPMSDWADVHTDEDAVIVGPPVVGQPECFQYALQAPAADAIDFDEIPATDIDAETAEDEPIPPRPLFAMLDGFVNTPAPSNDVAMLDEDASDFGLDDDGELLLPEADVHATTHSGPADDGLLDDVDDDEEDDPDGAASVCHSDIDVEKEEEEDREKKTGRGNAQKRSAEIEETRQKLGVVPIDFGDEPLKTEMAAAKYAAHRVWKPLPTAVEQLFRRKEFGQHSWEVNNHLALASYGVKGERVLYDTGVQSYKIKGFPYERMLAPTAAAAGMLKEQHNPILWYLFPGRFERKTENERHFVTEYNIDVPWLITQLEQYNPVFRSFYEMRQKMSRANPQPANAPKVRVSFVGERESNEVAAVFGETNEETTARVLLAVHEDGDTEFVPATSVLYEALGHPLINFFGEQTWGRELKGVAVQQRETIFRYLKRAILHEERLRYLHAVGQAWLVDAVSRFEDERLLTMKEEEKKRRAHQQSAGEQATNGKEGWKIPGSFTKSASWFRNLLEGALFLMMKRGRPQFFITLTFDTAEAASRLFPGRSANDDPVLVAQLFERRLRAFVALLRKGLLGPYVYSVVVVEWQKRGLPHAHILLRVHVPGLDMPTPSMRAINRVTTAEVSQLRTRMGRRIYRNTMRHKCTKACRSRLHRCTDAASCVLQPVPCKKKFPWPIKRRTQLDPRTGYVIYRRRQPADRLGVEVSEKVLVAWGGGHANTKVVSTGQIICYLFGYCFKGNDRATWFTELEASNGDQFRAYRRSRYLSSMEAAHRGFEFANASIHPKVHTVAISLPAAAGRYIPQNKTGAAMLRRNSLPALEGYCWRPEALRGVAFLDYVGEYDTDLAPRKKVTAAQVHWDRRPGQPKWAVFPYAQTGRLVRMQSLAPHQGELFYFSLLLKHGRDDVVRKIHRVVFYTWFISASRKHNTLQLMHGLRDVSKQILFPSHPLGVCKPFAENDVQECWSSCFRHDGQTFATYKAVVETAMPDLLHDTGADLYFRELIALGRTPPQLRAAFRMLKEQHGWEESKFAEYEEHLCNAAEPATHLLPTLERRKRCRALCEMDGPALTSGRAWAEIDEELDSEADGPPPTRDRLTPQQIANVYDPVWKAVEDAMNGKGGQIFILQALAGAGKTYTANALLRDLNARGIVALSSATSSIAAHQLVDGMTSHRRFGLPIVPEGEDVVVDVRPGSARTQLLRRAQLFIIDEAFMMDARYHEAINNVLQRAKSNQGRYGGAVVMLCGDWRQLPAVVPGATSPDEVFERSYRATELFKHAKPLRLESSERLKDAGDYGTLCEEVGNAAYHIGETKFAKLAPPEYQPENPWLDPGSFIYLPRSLRHTTDVEKGVQDVYPGIFSRPHPNFADRDWVSRTLADARRAYISNTNALADDVHERITSSWPGEDAMELHGSTVLRIDGEIYGEHYFSGDDFLGTLAKSGVPPGTLRLKPGQIVFFVANIGKNNPKYSKAVVLSIAKKANRVTVIPVKRLKKLMERGALDEVERYAIDIPRFRFTFRHKEIEIERVQFPLALAYAYSVHKSQGQTLDRLAIDLRAEAFCHGQLYVAMTRARGRGDVVFVIDPDDVQPEGLLAKNVVDERFLGRPPRARKKIDLPEDGNGDGESDAERPQPSIRAPNQRRKKMPILPAAKKPRTRDGK
jgi:hypothetical protein